MGNGENVIRIFVIRVFVIRVFERAVILNHEVATLWERRIPSGSEKAPGPDPSACPVVARLSESRCAGSRVIPRQRNVSRDGAWLLPGTAEAVTTRELCVGSHRAKARC